MSGDTVTFKHLKKIGERAVERAKKISLPLFDGVPLYDVTLFFWRSIVDGSITTRASGIAFSFFIALFPGIIFLVALIPFSGFQIELFTLIKELVPEEFWPAVEGTIAEVFLKGRGELLTINFFMALFFAINGIASMMNAFDATVHNIHRRRWWSMYMAAGIMLVIFTLLMILAFGMLIGGQQLIHYLDEIDIIRDKFSVYLLTAVKWIIAITIFFLAYSFLYYMAPAKKTKWRFISAGGTLATVLSLVGFTGMRYYLNNFNKYNEFYGSVGTLLAVLFLMYVMSLILLIGFELNASIYQAHTYQEEE